MHCIQYYPAEDNCDVRNSPYPPVPAQSKAPLNELQKDRNAAVTLFTSFARSCTGHTVDRQKCTENYPLQTINPPSMDEMSGEMECRCQWVLLRVLLRRSECNCKWCRVPTCTGSLILNQQVLLFLTSGLLQLALVAVVFAVRATNLQESQEDNDDDDDDDTNQSAFLSRLHWDLCS